ncbi:MAG: hypothetical protein RIS21_423 [Planctomycetota bacterium]|jgi:chromosomal replication initiator protein
MPPDVVTPELFEDVRTELKSSLSENAFKTWIAPIAFVGSEPGRVTLMVPSSFVQGWVNRVYAARIKHALTTRLGAGVDVVILAEAAATPATPPSVARGEVYPVTLATGDYAPTTRPAGGARVEGGMSLVPHYTFEHFIVGPHNQLAVAAGLSIATTGTRAYNPLFIHGRVGLGKTHLLQAICHGVMARNPDTRILYVSCEQFVNQFIAAVERGNLETFRAKYRQPDILVVDDIHFLAGKDRTAEEFFHTFNALHSNNRQIILSSDSPPMEIPSLSERLVSRFKQGMMAELEPPLLETRVQLVHRKALSQGIDLPQDIAQVIAETIQNNVRELEGAVTKVVATSMLLGRPVTMELAKQALSGLVSDRPKRVTIDDIVAVVSERVGMRRADLQSKRRTKPLTEARQLCMFLARQLTRLSLEETGAYFGGRDHSTVLYSIERVETRMGESPDFRKMVENLQSSLSSGNRG